MTTNTLKGAHADHVADDELVRRFRADPNGDAGRRAASTLFERHREGLYAWCYRHVREREGALQLAQETLLAAFKALPSFEGRAQFSSWLFAIARYKFLSSLRRARLPIDEAADLDQLPASHEGIEDAFVRREEEQRVLAAIGEALERDEQTALWLRCIECKPVDEITRMMKLDTRSGARSLLQSARRKLRAHLGQVER